MYNLSIKINNNIIIRIIIIIIKYTKGNILFFKESNTSKHNKDINKQYNYSYNRIICETIK